MTPKALSIGGRPEVKWPPPGGGHFPLRFPYFLTHLDLWTHVRAPLMGLHDLLQKEVECPPPGGGQFPLRFPYILAKSDHSEVLQRRHSWKMACASLCASSQRALKPLYHKVQLGRGGIAPPLAPLNASRWPIPAYPSIDPNIELMSTLIHLKITSDGYKCSREWAETSWVPGVTWHEH